MAVPFEQGVFYETIAIGANVFPPLAAGTSGLREGGVVVSVTTGQNLDKPKATGTDKQVTKRQGKQPAKVEIALWWTFRIDDQVTAMIQEWDPNGPGNGGPFTVLHPETERRRVKDLVFEKMGPIERVHGGNVYRVKLEAEEWNPPKPAKKGGTATPKKSQTPGTGNIIPGGASGSTGISGSASTYGTASGTTGLSGANAPDAKP